MTQVELFAKDSVPPAPDRQSGLNRLNAFMSAMGSGYAQTRNYDYGPEQRQNVSVLSAHVRHRLILEEELARAALERHGFKASEKFLQEVCWRTYWKGWLARRPSVWGSYKLSRDEALHALCDDPERASQYERAMYGETGLEPFDTWARELLETGYLHNHARMWMASIWVYTLKLPWQLGADWFLRHLIDGDAASNTLSWRWVCGLHTAGKTYLARAENIQTYTGGRFALDESALAEQAPPLDPELQHPKPVEFQRAPSPKHGQSSLLVLHEEDGHPESWNLEGIQVRGVAIQAAPISRGCGDMGQISERFTRGALSDLKVRAQGFFGLQPVAVGDPQAVIDLAHAQGLSQIVMASPHQGPLADEMRHWVKAFQRQALYVGFHERDWDHAFFRHADKGFFKLKSKIEGVIAALGLVERV